MPDFSSRELGAALSVSDIGTRESPNCPVEHSTHQLPERVLVDDDIARR
jgi:hypothetical protein